jgi:hypothetical protein
VLLGPLHADIIAIYIPSMHLLVVVTVRDTLHATKGD